MRRRGLFAASVVSALLAGCSGSSPQVQVEQTTPALASATTIDGPTSTIVTSTPPPAPPAALHWVACKDPSVTDAALDCATVTVPLDYNDPTGTTIDLALVRKRASGKRAGAVLFNPGGPGGSGFDFIAADGTFLAESLGITTLDLIGFDPRGVDRSGGLHCETDAERDKYAYLDDTPDTPAEQALLDEADTAFATACKAHYGNTLPLYSTVNTAKDIERIRQAIGDDQISFIGASYGTYLGAMYASLFPDHVRALVLDSAFEPDGDTVEQQFSTQLVGRENALAQWATWCQKTADCTFTAADVGARWDALLAALDAHPVTAADGRIGNQSVMETATIRALDTKSLWPDLASALAKAENGNVKDLFALADDYSGRAPDGVWNTLDEANSIINCASGFGFQQPTDKEALAAELRALAPHFGKTIKASDFKDGCALLMPEQHPPALSYQGTAPIVVVGGTNDPATPIRWAQKMAGVLGPNARLVTFTGEGHGQIGVSRCVTKIEGALLVSLKLPSPGTVCDPDPAIERPAFWDSIPVPAGVSPVLTAPGFAALGLSATREYSEVRSSDQDEVATIKAYDAAMKAAGFAKGRSPAALDGAQRSIYRASDGKTVTILALGKTALATTDLAGIADIIGAGKTLVLLLYQPQ